MKKYDNFKDILIDYLKNPNRNLIAKITDIVDKKILENNISNFFNIKFIKYESHWHSKYFQLTENSTNKIRFVIFTGIWHENELWIQQTKCF